MRKWRFHKRWVTPFVITAVLAGAQLVWGLAPLGQDSSKPNSAAPPASTPPSAMVQPVFVADILYEAAGHPVTEPLVQARIAGRQVLLSVDTGARITVLDPSLAAPAGGEAGGRKPNWANNLAIEIGGERLMIQTVALQSVGENLIQDQGIYGFLSPQDLARSFAVMIDFPGRRLFGFRSPDGMQAWLKQMGLVKQAMAVDVRVQEGKLAISATAGAGPPVWLEMNTAAPDTVLPPGYSIGKTGRRNQEMSGHEVKFRRVKISLGGGLDASGAAYEPLEPPAGGLSSRMSPHLGVDFLRHFMIGIPDASPKVIWMVGGR